MQDWKPVEQAISEADTIILFTHIHADGDCLGSSFSLAYFLCGLCKQVTVLTEETPPPNLSYLYDGTLPDNLNFRVWDAQNINSADSYDLAIAIDTSDEKRIGERKEYFYKANRRMRIDHHISKETFAEITVCNTAWAATAEGIWEYIKTQNRYQDSPYLKKIAECVYTGILTDTGCFAYSNVTVETHRIAAELMEIAGNMAWQYSNIYENQTKNEIALKAFAYGAVEYYADGRIAFLQITRDTMDAVGATDDDLESFAPFLRCIEKVSVGIFAKPGRTPGNVRISLRSDEVCDVAAVAAKYGGGGHKRAAGLLYNAEEPGTFEEFKKNLIGEIEKWMA